MIPNESAEQVARMNDDRLRRHFEKYARHNGWVVPGPTPYSIYFGMKRIKASGTDKLWEMFEKAVFDYRDSRKVVRKIPRKPATPKK
jgi:hypothetical protein